MTSTRLCDASLRLFLVPFLPMDAAAGASMTFLDLLRQDLEHQYRLQGSAQPAPLWHILVRILHPRFLPLVLIRMAQRCEDRGFVAGARAASYLNILLFGIDVGAKCQIGPGLFLPHTSGTVIGASRIGRDVIIFQNVTLGTKYPDMGWHADLRPSIGDRVILGAGCKILGSVHLGDDSIVAANSVVLSDVPDKATVAGIPASIVRGANQLRK